MNMIHDDCLRNLYLCQETMKDWVPMTEYEMIYEAAVDPVTAKAAEKNNAIADKSTGYIQKAIDAVKSLINKLITMVKDFIDRITLKGEEKAAFEKYRKMCAEDPSLKNKKVTVQDFRQKQQQYNELLNEVEKEIKKSEAEEGYPVDNVIKKITDKAKNIAGSTGVIMSADAAMKIAESNVQAARVLNGALNTDYGLMDKLSKALGEKDASKFKKRVGAAARNTKLTRLKIHIMRRQYDSIQDCVKSTLASVLNPMSSVTKHLKNNEDTAAARRVVINSAKKGAINAAKQKLFPRKGKEYRSFFDFASNGGKKDENKPENKPEDNQ